jgi:predicted ribosome quality control (RQC) complex YloA/Tae2 family protein
LSKQHRPPEPKAWVYSLPGGFTVHAGKTDADNDRLSLRFARANDLWFHVRGMPGSHVVLRVEETEPDRETIRAAAAIAAYHSKARGGGSVAVTWTLARNVRKPKGARAGTVTISKESVIKVRPALPDPPD